MDRGKDNVTCQEESQDRAVHGVGDKVIEQLQLMLYDSMKEVAQVLHTALNQHHTSILSAITSSNQAHLQQMEHLINPRSTATKRQSRMTRSSSTQSFTSVSVSHAAKVLAKKHIDKLIREDGHASCHTAPLVEDDEFNFDSAIAAVTDPPVLDGSHNTSEASDSFLRQVPSSAQSSGQRLCLRPLSRFRNKTSHDNMRPDGSVQQDTCIESQRHVPQVSGTVQSQPAACMREDAEAGSRPSITTKTSDDKKTNSLHNDSLVDWTSHNAEQLEAILPGALAEDVRPRRASSMPQMDSLRARTTVDAIERVAQRVPNCSEGEESGSVGFSAMRILSCFWAMCGALPWNSHYYASWYQRFIRAFLVCASLLKMFCLVQEPKRIYENIAHLSMYFCTMLCLASFTKVAGLVGPEDLALVNFAKSHQFMDEWSQDGLKRLALTASIWLLTSAASILNLWLWDIKFAFPTMLMSTMCYGLFFAIFHCMWQVFACLELMVDSYCVFFLSCQDCTKGVAAWNSLQALLRRSAEALENSFLVVHTAITITLVCGALRGVEIALDWTSESMAIRQSGTTPFFYCEVLLIVLSGVILFTKAASVTRKCCGVPALVNSVWFEPDKILDEQRQYLVIFIANSHAGFYVKGTRFTYAMLLKFCYLFGTLVCGLGTTILNAALTK